MKTSDVLIAWNCADTADSKAPPGSIAVGPLLDEGERDWAQPYDCTGARPTLAGASSRDRLNKCTPQAEKATACPGRAVALLQ